MKMNRRTFLKTLGLAAGLPILGKLSTNQAEPVAEFTESRYVHEAHRLGFVVTEEAIEESVYQDLSEKYAKALAESMRTTKEDVVKKTLESVFSSSTGKVELLT
jgi:hypothetical protein